MTVQETVWSSIVANTDRSDRGEIRRAWDPLQAPILGVDGCRTLYEGLRRGASIHPMGSCLGFRAVSTSGMATPFIYMSYSECLARVEAVAAGLDTLKLVERNDQGLILIGLYMKNCVEWVLGEHAVYCLGGATVPFYDTLGPDVVTFILNQTNAKSVICCREQVARLAETKKSGQCPWFTTAIVVDGVTPDVARTAGEAGLDVVSFAKVEAVGARRIATDGHKHSPPDPTDICTFCYTSGTTGNPKGALITHQNLMAGGAGVHISVPELKMRPHDRHLSYLPLAHIFERMVMAQLLTAGASIAFFRGDPTLLIEDLQACRPTTMPVAPRVLNKIYDKVRMRASFGEIGMRAMSLSRTWLTTVDRSCRESRRRADERNNCLMRRSRRKRPDSKMVE